MSDNPVQSGPSPILARAKGILMAPAAEWQAIAGESDSPKDVFLRYVVPLAAIGPVAAFIGGQVFGYGALGFTYRPSLMTGITTLITSYVMALVSVWLVAFVANFLSPKFGGKDDYPAAFRLVAYAMTASMVGGIVGLLPALSVIGLLFAIYSLYLFYKGAVPVMGVAPDKLPVFTIATVVAAFVISLIAGAISTAITAPSMIAAADAQDQMSLDMGGLGSMQASEDGSTMTITGPDGEQVNITVDNNGE
ncbi:Yip1 family protein [Aurantiacibacter flavus]|uniref:Yip1 family protein n=1 Tax=Aurantiacibacter flavus TaxID=3145232 RepID=A0ABV0CTY7_9SPHN